MGSRIADLRLKEVVNIRDGCRLGFVSDVEIDVECGRVVAIVVPGPCRFWFFLREPDFVIPWDGIEKIGEDIILVNFAIPIRPRVREKRGWF
jgi:YlmC/YmxH family sporulation protein